MRWQFRSVVSTSLKLKSILRPALRITTYYVILNAFYELDGNKLTFFLISFVIRIQNDVCDDVMRDLTLSLN